MLQEWYLNKFFCSKILSIIFCDIKLLAFKILAMYTMLLQCSGVPGFVMEFVVGCARAHFMSGVPLREVASSTSSVQHIQACRLLDHLHQLYARDTVARFQDLIHRH